jgi:hypothetical protein
MIHQEHVVPNSDAPDLLLFDSGCVTCTQVAATITRLTGGAMAAHSLREPEVERLLTREVPGWRPRPMLVRQIGSRVRVYQGSAMVFALVRRLGVPRSVSVLRLLGSLSGRSADDARVVDRRAAIIRGAGFVGAATFGWRSLNPSSATAAGGAQAVVRDEAALNRVADRSMVAAAARHLGPIAWHDVYRIDGGYVLQHLPPREPATAAFTAIDDAAEGVAISYALVKRNGALTIEWMTVWGHHLTTTLIPGSRNAARASGMHTAVASSEFRPMCATAVAETAAKHKGPSKEFIKFLVACLSIELGQDIGATCAQHAYWCFHKSPSACIQFARCAGAHGKRAYQNCIKGCPPG